MSHLHGHTTRYTVTTDLVEQVLVDLGGDARIEHIVREVGKRRRATMTFSQRVQRPFMWRFLVLRALEQNPRCVQDNEGSSYWRLKSYRHPYLSAHEAACNVLKDARNTFTACAQ